MSFSFPTFLLLRKGIDERNVIILRVKNYVFKRSLRWMFWKRNKFATNAGVFLLQFCFEKYPCILPKIANDELPFCFFRVREIENCDEKKSESERRGRESASARRGGDNSWRCYYQYIYIRTMRGLVRRGDVFPSARSERSLQYIPKTHTRVHAQTDYNSSHAMASSFLVEEKFLVTWPVRTQ